MTIEQDFILLREWLDVNWSEGAAALSRIEAALALADETINANMVPRIKALTKERDALKVALENYVRTYPTCPCGAWIGEESKRPHVTACPVAQAIKEMGG